jgi:hypothetical protein
MRQIKIESLQGNCVITVSDGNHVPTALFLKPQELMDLHVEISKYFEGGMDAKSQM